MKQNAMSLLLLISLTITCSHMYAQKKHTQLIPLISKATIGIDAYENWDAIKDAKISNNGKYCSYTIEGIANDVPQLVLKSTRNTWTIGSSIVGPVSFTQDSKKAVWINEHDSLCIVTLGKKKIKYIPDVAYYILKEDYLSYKVKMRDQIFTNLVSNIEEGNFYASNRSDIITKIRNELISLQIDSNGLQSLQATTKGRNKLKKIWEGTGFTTLFRDINRNQISFISNNNKIWYYRKGMRIAIELKTYIDSNFTFNRLNGFSKDGNNLFITLTDRKNYASDKDTAIVRIWSYLDNELESSNKTSKTPKIYTIRLNIHRNQPIKINDANDWVFLPKYQDSVALLRSQERPVSADEMSWNKSGSYKWQLISLTTFNKKKLENIGSNKIIQLSDNGKYIIYFDQATKNFYSYSTQTLKVICITHGIEENWEKNEYTDNYGRYIAGWEKDDRAVFIYGQQDIWKIDPSGITPPMNFTNGYGKANNIIFSFALEEYSRRSIRKNEQVILTAFNIMTKDNGFYKKKNGSKGDPDSLTMSAHIYYLPYISNLPNGVNYAPIKAHKAKKYIVRRMSATESPNYYLTSNFRAFKQLSNIAPEKTVNWYTSELHEWVSSNMEVQRGILYKPENFTSSTKYPVILHYYEKKTDGLNAYMKPSALENGCAINIPYYVSNGYLVFCPDISYEIGDPMTSTATAVISAAEYISTKQYVDSKKMGVQGCSWGAIQTNYIITHSSVFTAAVSASGIANWVSGYNSITEGNLNMQGMYENGQFRMAKTLWENPNAYIKNSSVFNADKITTPLLLMHTKNDEICPLSNIVQLFTSLLKLSKKSWMLIYDGNHGLHGKESIDFSIRMKEFFDHFLLNNPAPYWLK